MLGPCRALREGGPEGGTRVGHAEPLVGVGHPVGLERHGEGRGGQLIAAAGGVGRARRPHVRDDA